MMRTPRTWLRKELTLGVIALAVALLIAGVQRLIHGPAAAGTGYFAKVMCSGVFVSGRDPGSILSQELNLENPAARVMRVEVDRKRASVTASLAGVASHEAIYRPGLGCTLVSEISAAQLRAQPLPRWPATPPPPPADDDDWPRADAAEPAAPALDQRALEAAAAAAFAEPDAQHPQRTRALLIVEAGRLVYERYAAGFHRDMPLQGWSMTKSVGNALVGVLVREGKLSLGAAAPVAEWSGAGDPRHAITLDQLMRMSSGLAFRESYTNLGADAVVMLFRKPDAGAYAAARPLAHAPDTVWEYSSGTANILARIVRHAVGGSLEDYWTYPRRALFDRIGVRTAVFEPDASGVFVGSSFLYASARDWARLGLLYLNDGVWNGTRILPQGWVRYSTTPTPRAPLGEYGAQIWLNAGAPGDPARRLWPGAPRDAFAFEGFEGQHVFVIPSLRLVVVRLGLSQAGSRWDEAEFLARVAGARQTQPNRGKL